ncbi:hypothetical protein ACKI1J_15150 [Streptomyces scabiei]
MNAPGPAAALFNAIVRLLNLRLTARALELEAQIAIETATSQHLKEDIR